MLMEGQVLSEKPYKPIILIVDDIARNLQVLGNIVKEENFQIAFSTSGKKALEMVEELKPDLILLDIMMPEMDGYEVCEKLKANPATANIPVIFLTAKTETTDMLKGFSLGAVDYIAKPFNSGELLARVRTHCELKLSKDTIVRQKEEFNELVHVLCHDLKNPIGSARSIMDLLDSPESIESLLPHLKTALDTGLEIIDLVRQIRALTEKKKQLELLPTAIAPVLDKCVMMLEHRAKEKGVEFKIECQEDVSVLVEEVSFANSVINNLLTNAIKFSNSGGVITLDVRLEEERVVLEIKDEGIGMPNKIAEKIFDVKAATSRLGTEGEEGTGFGMPLVKKFVEAYGGTIMVLSKDIKEYPDDHGTCVRIVLKKD